MLLAIDVGNTQTVVGIFESVDNDTLLEHWRLSTVTERTADEYALLIVQFLNLANLTLKDITGIAYSSSVPQVTSEIRQSSNRWLKVPLIVVEPGVKTGMPILYDNPKEVGADRITNAVAAYERFKGPTIVVDLGTATTFDAISKNGEYLGGAITPGIQISMEALFKEAAALRSVELVEPKRAIGKSTVESLQSGAIYGFVSQVDGICERFEEELGKSTVVATGGLAVLVTGLSKKIKFHDPWLTLHGLRIIFSRNISLD
jgi:type III pantothenate kinase